MNNIKAMEVTQPELDFITMIKYNQIYFYYI